MYLMTPDGKEISLEEAKSAIKALGSADEATRQEAFAALTLPLRAAAPRESSARQIFSVISLGQEEDAIFPVDTDEEVEVVMANAYGMPPISTFMTDVVTVATHTYQGAWELPEQLVNAGRIDQVERNAKRLLSGFVKKEEEQAWGVVRACIGNGNTINEAYDEFGVELINDALIYGDENDVTFDKCFISPKSMGDLRMYCKEVGFANEVRYDMWKRGVLTGLWGIDFYVLNSIGDDEAFFFDTNQFGVMPVRQDMETREDPAARAAFKVRVYAQSQFGLSAIVKKAVLKAVITRS